MFTGFVTAFYLALAVWAAIDLPSDPFPARGAMAFFLLLPLLVVSISGEIMASSFDEQKAVRAAIKRNLMTRRHAYAAGLGVGIPCIAAVAITWWFMGAVSNSMTGRTVAFILSALELIVFPALAAGYLFQKANSRLAKHEEQPQVLQ